MQYSAFARTMMSKLQIEKLERVDNSHNSSDIIVYVLDYYLQCDPKRFHS